MPGTPIDPARILKVLWLLQKVAWVPRVPETLAKLLVRDLKTEIPPLRVKVEQTLDKLQEAGYVARDEATGEWKFLNEKERTIEQTIQEMVRPEDQRASAWLRCAGHLRKWPRPISSRSEDSQTSRSITARPRPRSPMACTWTAKP